MYYPIESRETRETRAKVVLTLAQQEVNAATPENYKATLDAFYGILAMYAREIDGIRDVLDEQQKWIEKIGYMIHVEDSADTLNRLIREAREIVELTDEDVEANDGE